jgi:Protein of unknown function (DUF4238)
MPHNKKHHYVPRLYLKNFAENNGRTINIHNFKSKKTILAGNLYNQCKKDYLYGKDSECEASLGLIESAAGKVISSILTSKYVPHKMTEQYYFLLVFVLFQKNRTLAAGEEIDEQMDNLHTNIFIELAEAKAAEMGISRQELEEVTVRYEHPERAALGHTAQLIPLTFDLNLKALEAMSSLEFITSDNPVVFYNPFSLGSLKIEGSATGFQSRGLQVYLPLSSRLTLLYYDSTVYKVGGRKKTIVPIDDENVRSLNFLQLLNATENTYFQSVSMARYVEKEAARAAPKRKGTKSGVRTIATSATSEIVHFYRQDIDHRVKLQFCKLREQPPAVWDPRVVGPRKPELSSLHARFLDELHEGKWQASDFGKFLETLRGTPNHPASRG